MKCVMLLALVLLLQAAPALAQTSGFAATLTSPDYVVGTTPTQIAIVVTFTTGISANGDTVILTLNKALFTASANPTVTLSGASGSPVWTSKTVAVNGLEITLILNSGSIDAADTVTFTVTSDFVTLPSSGAVTCTATSTGDTAGTPVTVFYILAAPTISLTSSDLNAGTRPSSLQVVTKTPLALTSGQTIVLTMSQWVLKASVSTGLTITGATLSGYTTNAGGTEFTMTLGANVNADVQIDMTLGSALMADLPSVAGAVTATLVMNSITTFSATTGYGTIVYVASSGSDPIARFGDVERLFELPPKVLTPLLVAPDITIHGSVFLGGGSYEQWFNRIVLTPPAQDQSDAQDRFLEIRMKPNLHELSDRTGPEGEFRALDIIMGYGNVANPIATTTVPLINTNIPMWFLGHQVVFRRTYHTQSSILPRECADIAGPSMHFYICTSPAAEYDGHSTELTLKYAHLNMAFVEVHDYKALTGLLPELWGVQPMSDRTAACVKQDMSVNKTADRSSTGAAWAGGLDVEDLRIDSLQQNGKVTPALVTV